MTDPTRRDALARQLCARISDERRSFDELRVICWVLEGLELGAEDYGPLDVRTDPRNWRRERAMECRDALFYSAAQALVDHDARVDAIEASIDAEESAAAAAMDLRVKHALTASDWPSAHEIFDLGGEA